MALFSGITCEWPNLFYPFIYYVTKLVFKGSELWECCVLQLRNPTHPNCSVPTAMHCLATLLREQYVRALFVQADGVKLLIPLISPASTQQSIQVFVESCNNNQSWTFLSPNCYILFLDIGYIYQFPFFCFKRELFKTNELINKRDIHLWWDAIFNKIVHIHGHQT